MSGQRRGGTLRRLVRREAADHDLVVQVDYLRRLRPSTARRYLTAVERAYRRLVALPEIGRRRPVDGLASADLRVWPVPGFARYHIYYRMTAETVEIVRVLHDARDLRRVFGRR